MYICLYIYIYIHISVIHNAALAGVNARLGEEASVRDEEVPLNPKPCENLRPTP